MKLQQLRTIVEIARHELNLSAAAEIMHTSQPGLSKQLKQLEQELGVILFTRRGKHLTDITPAGKQLLQHAERVLAEMTNIKRMAAEHTARDRGSLSIATTHTQARYALPKVISRFRKKYPHVSLHMHQGTPMQIAEMAATGQVDFAIATEAMELFDSLVMLPCYRWNRCIVVPQTHPLAGLGKLPRKLKLAQVAAYPILTYVFGFTGRSQLDQAFAQQKLNADVVFTATDADVIKTYVRAGLGIGIIANMAYDPLADRDLVAIDAAHLFAPSTTHIGCMRGARLREFMLDFIELFAPHLTHERVTQAMLADSAEQCARLFNKLPLPNF